MNWITETIAIGNYLEAQDADLLRGEGIGSILSLDGSLQGRAPLELGVKAIRVIQLHDGPGNDPSRFLAAVDAVAHLLGKAPPLLVQCHAGRSRSVVVVAGHLVKARRRTPDEALRLVASKREAQVTPGMADLLWHIA